MTSATSSHALARRAHNDAIRVLYEDTLVPVREIARLAGVTERNIYALVRRLGCRPRIRLASGGGRRIVPLASPTDAPLDAAGVDDAIQRCAAAVAEANRISAESREARERTAVGRRARRAAKAQARAFELLMRAKLDLVGLAEDEL